METQLRHSLTDGATHLRGRFKVTSPEDVVSRAYLNVNTTRSAVSVDGYVRKFTSIHGTRSRLGDERLRVGAGVSCLFGTNQQVPARASDYNRNFVIGVEFNAVLCRRNCMSVPS